MNHTIPKQLHQTGLPPPRDRAINLRPETQMTNKITIALLLLIAVAFGVDHIWLNGDLPLAAAKTVDTFIEYLSFWR